VQFGGQPSILLADEPTGNLDSTNGEAVMELMRELHRAGATICMVTHDPRYAQHADRIVHLFDGLIVEEEAGADRREIPRSETRIGRERLWSDSMISLRGVEKSFPTVQPGLTCCADRSGHQAG
jgi:ABC-type multidrug transport system ATPase subunit